MIVYSYWKHLLGIDILLISIVVFIMAITLLLLIFLLHHSKRKLYLKIIIAICTLFIMFFISFEISDQLVSPITVKKVLFRQTKDLLGYTLNSYYEKYNRYPPFDGMVDSLCKLESPFFNNESNNPYTGIKYKYTKILHYDSVMSEDYSISKEDIGLIAYKVSVDGQSCAFYFIDYDTWRFRPVFLEAE